MVCRETVEESGRGATTLDTDASSAQEPRFFGRHSAPEFTQLT